ncbi:MAG: excinuclease ABC subunit UvrA [Candidatus Margulisiibacteriota bacterium]|jgi:excinuclease ABC subunit A
MAQKHHDELRIVGARVHNLKNVNLTLPKNKLIVFTGLSGSGKSSLAFDTIYAEGQRRYVESLSSYARQFLEKLDKPDVEHIEGLAPAISIDQKTSSHNPRSIVGTITEIYDYLRILFANIGKPICPNCGKPIKKQSIEEMVNQVFNWSEDTSILILAPLIRGKKGEFKNLIETIVKNGFSRYRLDGQIYRTEEIPEIDKKVKHNLEIVVDRITINSEEKSRIFESIETALKEAKGLVLVEKVDGKESVLFSENFSCVDCQVNIPEISPRLFSFNAPYGACEKCKGLGDIFDFDPDLVVENKDLPLRLATQKCLNLDDTYYGESAARLARVHGYNLEMSFNALTKAQQNIFLYGDDSTWEGVIGNLKRRYFQTNSEGMRFFFQGFMSAKTCANCNGTRLNKWALAVKLQGKSIAEVINLSTLDCKYFFDNLILTEKEAVIAKLILREIKERLSFLIKVGLTYITLARKASTLSGGELQRIRLATQIGSGLTGVLYILDEPSIGLHQRDNEKLIETLFRLRDLGNTVIVVEHDEEIMRKSDFIVDIGPGAGKAGGEIIFAGTLEKLLEHQESSTARFLSGNEKIEILNKKRVFKNQEFLTIVKASENNLKNITVKFPLKKFIVITGVSGSGKSSLINNILNNALMRHFYKSKETVGRHEQILGLEHIDKVITIDQSPIGRTPRSNPATYTQLFTPIRELFAELREAKIRGYKLGRFSFNTKGGRCEACSGDGMIKIEMHFLADTYVTCEVCKGKRYNSETLEVKFKGYNIADVLNFTVQEAYELFKNFPQIAGRLQTLIDVGLDYIHLGQSATTLSGGEAQRIKLSKELSKRGTGKTIYLLDEPTTGLHFADIKKLLAVLNRLVDAGNTVIVIEHNLDVIKTADHIIDLGPVGGDKGGFIVAEGPPEKIISNKKSYTGQFLGKHL